MSVESASNAVEATIIAEEAGKAMGMETEPDSLKPQSRKHGYLPVAAAVFYLCSIFIMALGWGGMFYAKMLAIRSPLSDPEAGKIYEVCIRQYCGYLTTRQYAAYLISQTPLWILIAVCMGSVLLVACMPIWKKFLRYRHGAASDHCSVPKIAFRRMRVSVFCRNPKPVERVALQKQWR